MAQFRRAEFQGRLQWLQDPHGAMVGLGLSVGLLYLPQWLNFLIAQIERNGSGSFCLAVCLVMGGSLRLWQVRSQLVLSQPIEVDRWLGSIIIGIGIFLFPFCRFALYAQALVWLLILIGIATNRWGLSFFRQQLAISGTLALSVYPNPGHMIATFWQALLPPQGLESVMAWATARLLGWIGQPVSVLGPLLLFPEANVRVGWGCNGFDMALSMVGFSLWLGLYLRLSGFRILQLSCLGIVLALLINVPRLLLMSLAAVYWGPEIFNFFHGPLGGQGFVVLLLALYYGCINKFGPTL